MSNCSVVDPDPWGNEGAARPYLVFRERGLIVFFLGPSFWLKNNEGLSLSPGSTTVFNKHLNWCVFTSVPISNGNKTELSPIRSVIIRVINKIRRPHSGSPICLITSMITDEVGQHEVLLPINHNFNKICDIIGYFLNQNTRNSKFCFASSEKKSHLSARVMARTVQLLRHDAYCPIKLSN